MSDSRETHKLEFLDAAGWGSRARTRIAGDASNRSYDRLTNADGSTAILMDAPPEKGEDVRPFMRIATFLTAQGLSAPEILFADDERGFLLLEDLGDDLFARVIARDPTAERNLYEAAVDALVHLHKASPPPLTEYSAEVMTSLAALVFDWYLVGTESAVDEAGRDDIIGALKRHLAALGPTRVVVLRDYHAENLIWLPRRDGVARVGLLDFQDAVLGHPAYDLVSVLQDARRDVPPDLASEMFNRFVMKAGLDAGAMSEAYALLGLQRNLRILGVFARLSLKDGKRHYIDLIPRVWAHVLHNLSHPALSDLAEPILTALPAPTPDRLEMLRRKSGSLA